MFDHRYGPRSALDDPANTSGVAATLSAKQQERVFPMINDPIWTSETAIGFHHRFAVQQYRFDDNSATAFCQSQTSTSPPSNTSSLAATGGRHRTYHNDVSPPQDTGFSASTPPPPALACPLHYLDCTHTSATLSDHLTHHLSHFRGSPPRTIHCPYTACTASFSSAQAWTSYSSHITTSHFDGGTIDRTRRPRTEEVQQLYCVGAVDSAQVKELRVGGRLGGGGAGGAGAGGAMGGGIGGTVFLQSHGRGRECRRERREPVGVGVFAATSYGPALG